MRVLLSSQTSALGSVGCRGASARALLARPAAPAARKQRAFAVQAVAEADAPTADDGGALAEAEDGSEEPYVVASTRGATRESRRRGRRATARRVAPKGDSQYQKIIKGLMMERDGAPVVNTGVLGENKLHWYALWVKAPKEGKVAEALEAAVPKLGPVLNEDGELVERTLKAWVPKKKIKAWNMRTQKMGSKTLKYGDGGWVYVQTRWDIDIHMLIDQDLNIRNLHDPCRVNWHTPLGEKILAKPLDQEWMDGVHAWIEADEDEVEEERVAEIYGVGDGPIQGASERIDDKGSRYIEEEDEVVNIDGKDVQMRARRYVDDGNAGSYANPGAWSDFGDSGSDWAAGGAGADGDGPKARRSVERNDRTFAVRERGADRRSPTRDDRGSYDRRDRQSPTRDDRGSYDRRDRQSPTRDDRGSYDRRDDRRGDKRGVRFDPRDSRDSTRFERADRRSGKPYLDRDAARDRGASPRPRADDDWGAWDAADAPKWDAKEKSGGGDAEWGAWDAAAGGDASWQGWDDASASSPAQWDNTPKKEEKPAKADFGEAEWGAVAGDAGAEAVWKRGDAAFDGAAGEADWGSSSSDFSDDLTFEPAAFGESQADWSSSSDDSDSGSIDAASKGPPAPLPDVGSSVYIAKGPYRGFQGKVKAVEGEGVSARLKVETDVFGSTLDVDVDPNDL